MDLSDENEEVKKLLLYQWKVLWAVTGLFWLSSLEDLQTLAKVL